MLVKINRKLVIAPEVIGAITISYDNASENVDIELMTVIDISELGNNEVEDLWNVLIASTGEYRRWKSDNVICSVASYYGVEIPEEIIRSLMVIRDKQEYLENCSDNSVVALVQDTLKAEEDKVFHWVFDVRELGSEKWEY